MVIRDFLHFLLDDTLEEARLQSFSPADNMIFLGAQTAIAQCRETLTGDGMIERMSKLLSQARKDSKSAVDSEAADQWFWLSREMQIEWIANVVSVILMQKKLPTIVPPTRGGAIAAAKLLGCAIGE